MQALFTFMKILDLEVKTVILSTELNERAAKQISGGSSKPITVVGPRGLVKKLENPGVDAPGLTPEKGQKIASNTNGKKKGWITGIPM